jgi:ATP-dependent phosphofructokinase / diphosphate-dependent phosphofructokinase
MALRGNALIGQGGGPTAVINASLLGIVEEARRHSEMQRIFGMRFGILGLLGDQLLDLGAENAERLRVVGHSPSAALGTCRRRFTSDDAETALSILASYDIRFFFYIGGNDSAETAHAIQAVADRHAYPLRCIGVPKTIDNDLAHMDHTPGYGSIARYMAMSARDCSYDAAAILPSDQVTILEVMGRNAGWVAAATALARTSAQDPPHAIYVPERPLSAGQVVSDVERAIRRHGYALLVATETIRDEHGKPWARRTGDDGFGHVRLSGAAERIGALVEEKLKVKARFNKPGTLQRAAGWCVSDVDWSEAYLVGKMAVQCALDGAQDVMVTLLRGPGPAYACYTGLAPLTTIAHAERRLPADFLDDEGSITAAFVAYARPLIGGDLPEYARLEAGSSKQ